MSRKYTPPSTSDDEQQNDSAEYEVGVDYGNEPDRTVVTPIGEEVLEPITPAYGGFVEDKASIHYEREVVVLNHSVVNGKLLVYDPKNKTEAWLVDARYVVNKKTPQMVTQSFLDSSERPYSWDSEIDSLVISPDDIRLGLWFIGMYTKKPIDLRKTVAGLVSRGTLPVMKK